MDFASKILGMFKNNNAALNVETAEVVDEVQVVNEDEVIVTVRYGLTPHRVAAKKGVAITEVVKNLAKKLGLTMTADTVITEINTGVPITEEEVVEEEKTVAIQTTAGTNG